MTMVMVSPSYTETTRAYLGLVVVNAVVIGKAVDGTTHEKQQANIFFLANILKTRWSPKKIIKNKENHANVQVRRLLFNVGGVRRLSKDGIRSSPMLFRPLCQENKKPSDRRGAY